MTHRNIARLAVFLIGVATVTSCSEKQKAPTPATPASQTSEVAVTAPATAMPDKKAEEGRFFGAKMTEYPEWFKHSFLNLPEDVTEATQSGKRVMLLFQQNGCPYCNALVERNLAQKHIADKMKKNLDIIAVNMWGDRDITYVDGKAYTEKSLAEMLKVQFTPTLFFYDENGKAILRLNGYRSPERFDVDLDYVVAKKENEMSYRDFIRANFKPGPNSGQLHAEEFFIAPPFDLTRNNGKPLLVFFEQLDCPNCDALHAKVIAEPMVREAIRSFDAFQFDMWSEKTDLTTPQGRKTNAREWAKELDIKYAPSILVFNERGEEIIRSEAFFKVFHTAGIMTYVLDGAYKEQPSFQRYLSDKADRLREQGKDVDIWRDADEEIGAGNTP